MTRTEPWLAMSYGSFSTDDCGGARRGREVQVRRAELHRERGSGHIEGTVESPCAPRIVTHGRHCPCSACGREDWTTITVPCGMHGADCPAVYAPSRIANSHTRSDTE